MMTRLFKFLTNFGFCLIISSLTTATPLTSSSDHQDKITILDRLLGYQYSGETDYASGDIVIVAGLKGSGKSTMINFLTRNTTSMESYSQSSSNDGPFLIRTVPSSNATMMDSFTSELLTYDPRTNTIFLELPSPRVSNRSQEQLEEEIFDAFTLTVVGVAKRIKLLLVASQSSLGDHNNFKNLLNHLTQLIVEPTKFRRGVNLIVTKVESSDSDDRQIKSAITSSLENFLQTHQHIVGRPLVDGLLEEDGSKINIFRQPQTAGLLSTIPTVQMAKTNLQNMVDQSTTFIKNESPSVDFTISVSEEAKTVAATIENEVKDRVTHSIRWLAQEIIGDVQNSTHALEALQVGQSIRNLEDYQNKRTLIENMMSHLTSAGHPSKEFQEVTGSNYLGLEETADFSRLDDTLNFLRSLRAFYLPKDEEMITKWIQPLETALAFVDQENFKVNEFLGRATPTFKNLVSSLMEQYETLIAQNADSDLSPLYSQLNQDVETMAEIVKALLASESFEEYCQVLLAGLGKLSVQVSEELVALLENNNLAAIRQAELEETPLKVVENSDIFSPTVLTAQFQLLFQRCQRELSQMAVKFVDSSSADKFAKIVNEMNFLKEQ